MNRRPRVFSGLFFVTLISLVSSQVSAATTGAQKLSCPDHAKMRALVQSSWHEPDHRASFAVFRDEPAIAACYLVNELQVVPEKWIRGGDQDKHPKTMHVIWSLRALRYITGGINFKGKTKYRFNESSEIEANRKQFLRPENNEVPFFAVWMSRDSLAIAPPDAQNEIIGKWKKWYPENGITYNYRSPKTIEDWYF